MGKVILFVAEGFEEIEALTVVDVLRRAEIGCDMCSISENIYVKGSHGIEIKTDVLIKDAQIDDYAAVVLPGGMPGSTNLRDNDKVVKAVSDFYNEDKIVAAICAAPIVLEKANILKDKKVTSYPSEKDNIKPLEYLEEIVVEDGNLVTSRGPATTIYFALKLVEKIASKEKAEGLKKGMMLSFVEEKLK